MLESHSFYFASLITGGSKGPVFRVLVFLRYMDGRGVRQPVVNHCYRFKVNFEYRRLDNGKTCCTLLKVAAIAIEYFGEYLS